MARNEENQKCDVARNVENPKCDVILYYYPLSFFSQKVRMVLEEKLIPHTLEFIDVTAGENYKPWFVKLNPACEVPVINDGHQIIAGSQKIIDYLENRFTFTNGYKQLLPDRSTIEYHKAKYLSDTIDTLPMELITYGFLKHPQLTEKMKIPDFIKKTVGEKFFNRQKFISKFMTKNPDLRGAYAEKLSRVVEIEKQVENITLINAKLNEVELVLDKIEEHLKTNASISGRRNWWLCSDAFTVADISLAILLSRLYLLGLAQRFWSIASRPYLAIYYQRLNERPSFQKVAISHVTTSDLIMYGGASLIYSHGMTLASISTAVALLAIGGFMFAKRKK